MSAKRRRKRRRASSTKRELEREEGLEREEDLSAKMAALRVGMQARWTAAATLIAGRRALSGAAAIRMTETSTGAPAATTPAPTPATPTASAAKDELERPPGSPENGA